MPALKGPKQALDFGKAGLEGLPRPGNTAWVIAGEHAKNKKISHLKNVKFFTAYIVIRKALIKYNFSH